MSAPFFKGDIRSLETLMKDVVWCPCEDQPRFDHDGPAYATHHGVWHFQGQDIRVYRLHDGKAIIHADVCPKCWASTDASIQVPNLSSALNDIEEFLQRHEDVSDGSDGPRPNTAMLLLRDLRAARRFHNV